MLVQVLWSDTDREPIDVDINDKLVTIAGGGDGSGPTVNIDAADYNTLVTALTAIDSAVTVIQRPE
jgi:hypothetical protein